MGWLAFALALAFLAYSWWRVWRDWISPSRQLEELVGDLSAGRTPRSFLISGNARLRGTAIAL
jgi:HAMP domain-containing protein